jgi:hypothetical protein
VQVERWTPPTDGHNDDGQYEPSVHGFKGPLSVSVPGYPWPTDNRTLMAARELNGAFTFIKDPNAGRPIGLGEWLLVEIRFTFANLVVEAGCRARLGEG